MNVVFSTTDTAAPSTNSDDHKREACIFNAERVLDCGSIVSERNGRIISKTSICRSPDF